MDEKLPEEQLAVERPWLRWVLLAVRLCQIALAAHILRALPLPSVEEWLPLKNFVVAAGAIILMGKTLFDTLFYDRFVP